jgi:hypothetical protein
MIMPCPRNKMAMGEFYNYTLPHKRYRAVQSLPYRILAGSYMCMIVNKANSWVNLIYWFVEMTVTDFLWDASEQCVVIFCASPVTHVAFSSAIVTSCCSEYFNR